MTAIKRATPPNANKNVEKKLDHSYIVGGNIKWYNLYGKQVSSLLNN